MPIDPAHGRNIPGGRRMARWLRQFLDQYKQNAVRSLVMGGTPIITQENLYGLAKRLLPEYERHMETGARYTFDLMKKGEVKTPPQLNIQQSFHLFLPTIKPAAQKLSVSFVREFGETTQQAVRNAISAGLEAGEPLTRIQARLQQINTTGTVSERVTSASVFSPRRAALVAQTEASRAVHEGQMRYGMSVGATGLEWIASSDACPVCLSLNGKRVPYGTPFYVWPNAKEEYKYVFHPPAHPSCFCTSVDYFADEEEPVIGPA